jgi:hypothetical protein
MPAIRRWWCLVIGHDWGPWKQIALLPDLHSTLCLRCGTVANIDTKGWYAEFYKQELVRKGYRLAAMKDRNKETGGSEHRPPHRKEPR